MSTPDSVPLPRLFRAARHAVPGLGRKDFRAHVLDLEKSGHLTLLHHPAADKLHPKDAAHGIPDGGRLKYYAMTGPRGGDPWACGPHDEAADAAHKLVESGTRNASPPSRTDLFNALAHHGKMSSHSAGAAAREVHAKLAETGAVSQHDVRDAVHRHATPEAQAGHAAAQTAARTPGTNHHAAAHLARLYEEKTGRTHHAPGQVDHKTGLPSKGEVAARIEASTAGRLAGRSARRAAKDVHSHVRTHGHDFLTHHDFAAVLDKHAKNDYRHSTPADVAAALKNGAAVHPRHLKRAQGEAAGSYQKANAARDRLREKAGGNLSELAGPARAKWEKLTGRAAAHGDHIDTINDALARRRARRKGTAS